jgi:hypothetical protein
MRNFVILLVHVIVTICRLWRPNGARSVIKDVVRGVLANHYKPDSDSSGPSWLTFLGHMKDSLWKPISL